MCARLSSIFRSVTNGAHLLRAYFNASPDKMGELWRRVFCVGAGSPIYSVVPKCLGAYSTAVGVPDLMGEPGCVLRVQDHFLCSV